MKKEAWVVAADMGYGHQRAAYPLKDIAHERIINANGDKVISPQEKKTWDNAQLFYEWISRATEWSIVGQTIFRIYNTFQKIDPYYPRDSKIRSAYQVRLIDRQIKNGLCKSLIEYVKKKNIPFVTTFFIPAIAADYYELPKIYCIVTDTDVSRAWVPKDARPNKITYLAPCQHSVNRLVSYGVKRNKIILTGFPLPKECTGEKSEITKKFLARRLINLDPNKVFLTPNLETVHVSLKNHFSLKAKPRPITITFVVGGAGAQKEIGVKLIHNLKKKIIDNKIRVALVAGTHLDVKEYFENEIEKAGLSKYSPKNVFVLSELAKKDYFAKFNILLNETDILWTKPSELSFYSALGLPIIIAPPIGDQEGWNKKWLLEIGAGIEQDNMKYVDQWLEDWLADGRLARYAWQGFMNAPRNGTYEIEKVIFKK